MSDIELTVKDGVAVITLLAPARRNALTADMARELVAACDHLEDDRSIGAAVIQGSGGYFSAGAHREILANAGHDPAAAGAYSDVSAIYRSFARITELDVPTIAAVRGGAVGAGVNLLLACSLRVVAREARISSGFRRAGIHPGGGNLSLIHRAAGYEATVALGIFDQELSGARAAELGLAWVAVPDGEVESHALALATVAAEDPELSRMVMRSIRTELGPPAVSLAAALDLERAAQMRTLRRRQERSAAT